MAEISVIMPIYNTDKYLNECLEKIKNQSLNNYECIMIDDGSWDYSAVLCDACCAQDERFIVIHTKNNGPSISRNMGLLLASGDYFAFSDSDDIPRTQMLEILFFLLEAGECDAVFAELKPFDSSESIDDYPVDIQNEFRRSVLYERHEIFEKYVELTNCNSLFYGYMFTKMFRRQLFEGLQFPPDISCYEDVFLMADIFSRGKRFITLDLPVYYYRNNPSSLIRGGQNNVNKKYGYFVFLAHTADVVYREGYIDEGNKLMFQLIYSYLEFLWIEGKNNRSKEFILMIRKTKRLIKNRFIHIVKNPQITRMYRLCILVSFVSLRLLNTPLKYLFVGK